MSHTTHQNHEHQHGAGCGHKRIAHDDHNDYLHDGHLHRNHDGHVDECVLSVDAKNPGSCTPSHACGSHDAAHTHGPGCGHDQVPHGDHVDYLVGGHLHHPCSGHCDDHGSVAVV